MNMGLYVYAYVQGEIQGKEVASEERMKALVSDRSGSISIIIPQIEMQSILRRLEKGQPKS